MFNFTKYTIRATNLDMWTDSNTRQVGSTPIWVQYSTGGFNTRLGSTPVGEFNTRQVGSTPVWVQYPTGTGGFNTRLVSIPDRDRWVQHPSGFNTRQVGTLNPGPGPGSNPDTISNPKRDVA